MSNWRTTKPSLSLDPHYVQSWDSLKSFINICITLADFYRLIFSLRQTLCSSNLSGTGYFLRTMNLLILDDTFGLTSLWVS